MKELIKKIPWLYRTLLWAYLSTYRWYIRALVLSVPVRKLGARFLEVFMHRNLRVNIGAGNLWLRPGWKTLDFPSEHYGDYRHVDIIHDLASGLPFPFDGGSVSIFYSSHCIEHLPDSASRHFFDEVYRCLKDGGIFRITMPNFDLDIVNKDFEVTGGGGAGEHNSRWTYTKIFDLMKKAGFQDAYKSKAHQSRFREMRSKGRIKGFDSSYPEISLYVEAEK